MVKSYLTNPRQDWTQVPHGRGSEMRLTLRVDPCLKDEDRRGKKNSGVDGYGGSVVVEKSQNKQYTKMDISWTTDHFLSESLLVAVVTW